LARDHHSGSIVRVDHIHAAWHRRDASPRGENIGADRFTRLGVLVTIVVVVAGSAAELINYGFPGQRIQALDAASDGGVFGAVGDIAIAAAAVSAWILAARVRSARSVAVLAGLLTFLAADQVTDLHDHISHWLAFYLPVLAATFAGLVAVARGRSGRLQFRSDRGAGRPGTDHLIGTGLLLLAFSFLAHLSGERLLLELRAASPTGLAYEIKAVVKHGTEAAGWLLIALGLLRLARGCHLEAVQTH
jgi:hypothetical protein